MTWGDHSPLVVVYHKRFGTPINSSHSWGAFEAEVSGESAVPYSYSDMELWVVTCCRSLALDHQTVFYTCGLRSQNTLRKRVHVQVFYGVMS